MRFVFRLFGFGLLALILLVVAAGFFLDRGARAAVEKGVSYALGVPTSAGSVSVRPMQGSLGISELAISNPAGFSEHAFLRLDKAALSVQLSSLMKDVVEVPSLELSGIQLHLEGRGAKTNYGAILDNLKRLGSPAGTKPSPPSAEQGTQKRFIVHDLLIRNTTVEGDFSLASPLGNLANTKTAVNVPEIHLKDVGNGKSLSLPELSAQILKALLEAAASGNIPGLAGDITKDLQQSLSNLEKQAHEIEKGVEDALKGLNSGSTPKDVDNALKGVFKKKN